MELLFQTEYTLYPGFASDIFHTPIVRTQLTQRLPSLFQEMVDELDAALIHGIPLTEGVHENLSR